MLFTLAVDISDNYPWLLPLCLTALAISLGIFIQSVVGFGAGLFSIPILIWSGISLPEAIATLLAAVLLQTAYNTWQYRQTLSRSDVGLITITRLAGLPVGVYLLSLLATLDKSWIKFAIGCAILAAVGLMTLLKIKPKKTIKSPWTILAGLTSGLMAGGVGMGGPPVVLWVMSHKWHPTRVRVTLWATFMFLTPVQLGLMYFKFGTVIIHAALIGFALVPIVLLAAKLGNKVGDKISHQLLRRLALGLLVLLAVASIIQPLI